MLGQPLPRVAIVAPEMTRRFATYSALIDVVSRLADSYEFHIFTRRLEGLVHPNVLSARRAKSELRWRPRISLKEGIASLWQDILLGENRAEPSITSMDGGSPSIIAST